MDTTTTAHQNVYTNKAFSQDDITIVSGAGAGGGGGSTSINNNNVSTNNKSTSTLGSGGSSNNLKNSNNNNNNTINVSNSANNLKNNNNHNATTIGGGSGSGGNETTGPSGDGATSPGHHHHHHHQHDNNNPKKAEAGTKREETHGSVDFTLPSGVRGRERSKSVLSTDGPYRGMGKEELLRFSSRPLWRNLRYACMSIILTGWLALLITVVALVLTYPHCRDGQKKDWWQKTVVYRIYVRSFMDYQSDGIGDIRGLIQQLDYLQDTGVGTISLSPIYKLAPSATSDTHIVNHTEIDPVFGTMDDFKTLVNETHARGMHLILDFVPNHTSDQHPWFLESRKNADPRDNEYRSYYVWQQGINANQIGVPNSWQSVYNCPAWNFTTVKNSYYLHQFLDTQPDLNLRSDKVRVELEAILKFWLDLGVDGFSIRDADYLFEDYDLRDDILVDNSTKINCQGSSTTTNTWYPYDAYDHRHTKGLTELFDMLARWRSFLDDYGNTTNKYKLLIADVDADYNHVMHYYGLFNRDGVDLPLNRFSLNLTQQSDAREVAETVDKWLSSLPSGRWASWMGGDDRSTRLSDRLGPLMAMPYLIMTMLLPGTPYLYYGDEIGMGMSVLNDSLVTSGGDRRLATRGPMLWDDKLHAGFCFQSCQHTWLPQYPGYKTQNINVEAQKQDPYSMWHLFRNLTQLRKDYPSFEYGDYVKSVQDQQVFSFVREFDGEKGFLVALNFADEKVKRHFTGTHDTIPSGGKIEIVSGRTSRNRGNGVDLDPLTLEPHQGIVVSWDYVAEEI